MRESIVTTQAKTCSFCHGSGSCALCSGSGARTRKRGLFHRRVRVKCSGCGGSGICELCHGARVPELLPAAVRAD